MHIKFQLYDVLRFDSTVVIDVLMNISYPKLNNQIFKIPKHIVHEYTSGQGLNQLIFSGGGAK